MISPLGPAAAPSVAPTAQIEPREAPETRLDAAALAAETPAAPAIAAGQAETAIAVDPARASGAADVADDAARPDFLPPDPDAPTGPPPAFEASLLDRERELGVVPQAAPEPGNAPEVARAEPAVAEPRAFGEPAARDPYDAPPEPAARAEDGVATLRRLETPYDTATVDVAR